MRYFLHLAYDGLPYRGWQKQKGVASVQEEIEDALFRVCKETIEVVGCGRTDAQVHATQFFLHFEYGQIWDDLYVERLNQALPKEVVICGVYPVVETAHARFDAISRTYDYYIHTKKDPFLKDRSLLYTYKPLHFEKMKQAVEVLQTYNDYLSFCKTPDHNRTSICIISKTSLHLNAGGNRMVFSITGNRFLRGMVRTIVQKLLEIGNGELSFDAFEELLKNPQKPQIDALAAPYALYLSKVNYPYLDVPAQVFAPRFND